jgi:allantoinase
MAALSSCNPARRFGLGGKGDIALGYDADLALLDPTRRFTVRAAESSPGQGYTPFEGIEQAGRVESSFVRGERIFGRIVAPPPTGRYIRRPSPIQ